MSLKHTHSFSRGLTRAACIATVVGLSAFGLAASANAATTHFGPVSGSPVAVGVKPEAVAFDDNVNPTTGHKQVYVANAQAGTVSVIDATTHLVTNTITIGRDTSPQAIAVNQADDLIFVAEYADDSVAVIDGKTNTKVSGGNIVGSKPDAIAWDSANNRMYVANYGDGNVIAIDDQTAGQIGTPIMIGTGGTTSKPEGIAVDTASNLIAVAAQGDNKVFVINADNNNVATTTGTYASPTAVTVDSGRHLAYVANYDNNTVSVVDLTRGSEVTGSPIDVGANPNALTINQNTDAVYVANFNSPTISIIDPSDFSVTSGGPVGAKPSSIAVDSGQSGEVYVTNQNDNTVSILGTTVSPTITSEAPAAGTVGAAYNFPVTATGTPAPGFSVTGTLPPGLTVASNVSGGDGIISGVPTASGDFTFTLHASNGVDPEATATYTLHVDAAAVTPPPTGSGTGSGSGGGHLPNVAG